MITMANGLNASREYKKQLNELATEVFGFSFGRWQEQGLWDGDFECYSIIENGIMLANVSIYWMKLLINGIPKEYLQISTVATREEHRGKGLSRKLMEYIFNRYPETPDFLVGNDSVREFYPKFGFTAVIDKQPYVECSLQKQGEMLRLDITDPKIDFYLKGRTQYSGIFDCTNRYSINWFHLLYRYPKRIYEIPQLGLMLVAMQDNNILHIMDIAATKPVSFSQLIPQLHFDGVDTIEFGFNPDWLDVDYHTRDNEMEDSTLFVKGDFEVGTDYILPSMILA